MYLGSAAYFTKAGDCPQPKRALARLSKDATERKERAQRSNLMAQVNLLFFIIRFCH